jgi:uncharacterized protein YdaU (DUF1376 family)
MADKSTAFLFDIQDFRGSRSVQRMTWAQRGMYLEMLCEQWDKGSLPDDPAAVADLVGGTSEEWAEAWPVLRRKFVDRRSKKRDEEAIPTSHDASRRIINCRLEAARKKRAAYISHMKSIGRRGGRYKKPQVKELDASVRLAEPAKQSHPIRSDRIGLDRTGLDRTGSDLIPPITLAPSPERHEPDAPDEEPSSVNAQRAGSFLRFYAEKHQEVFEIAYFGHPQRDYGRALELCEKFTDSQLQDATLVWFGMDDDFATNGTRTVPKFASRITACLQLMKEHGIAS